MKKKILAALVALSALLFTGFSLFASDDTVHLAAYHGNQARLVELLSTGPDPDARDSYGGTALHAAMFQDNLQIVKLLVEAGYDVNAVGPRNGYTPLHDAVWADNLPALRYLVEQGGDLGIRGLDGQTPLDKALAEGKDEIATYLKTVAN